MAPKKAPLAASKASTATPRPRGRPPNKKLVKSSQFIDDEAEGPDTSDDDDMKSVKSSGGRSRPVSRAKPVKEREARPRGRPPNKKVVKSSQYVDDEYDGGGDTSEDYDMKSVKSSPRSRAGSKFRSEEQDTIDISSDDDDDTKSVRSVKSAMSVDEVNATVVTPPRKGRLTIPKTPSSRTSSISKKRSASMMTSAVSDEEEYDMSASPRKSMTPAQRVRFDNSGKAVTPLKSAMKKTAQVSVPDVGSSWFDDEDVFTNTPSQSTSKNSSKSKKPVYDSDEGALLSGFEDNSPKQKSPRKKAKNASETKGASKVESPGHSEDEDVYLEDLQYTSVEAPAKDESIVGFGPTGNRDPALATTYKGLVNIRLACIISWSNKPAVHPTYTNLLASLPNANKDLIRQAITYSGMTVRNLSRCDPKYVSTGFGGATYFHQVGGGSPTVFISVIRVSDCHLVEPKLTNHGKFQKVLEGACIQGEWERLVGAIGQIINEQEYKAPLEAGRLTFGTAFGTGDSVTSSPAGKRGARSVSGPNPFSRGPGGSSSTGTALSCHDTVPVYDARNVELGIYDIINDVAQLPRVNVEIPSESCALVAYTVNTWGGGNDNLINVSFNIKWAVVLGMKRGGL